LDAAVKELNARIEAARRRGDGDALETLHAELEQATARRKVLAERKRVGLAGIAEILDAAVADPAATFARLRPALPIALLPVRLETRFSADEQALLVRVYPDDIHADSHEPELTAEEIAAGERYLLNRTPLQPGDPGFGEVTDDERHRQAWAELSSAFDPQRAAWIARLMETGNPPQRAHSWTRAPRTQALPDRWVALGYRGGRRVFEVWGATIPDTLQVGPDPQAPEPPPGELPVDDGMRWMVEFDKAVAAGMGLRVPYAEDPDLPRLGLDELLVLGIKSTLTPDEAEKRLIDLLNAHHYSGGLGFVRQGTPTNNTEETSSGLDERDPLGSGSYDIEFGAPVLDPATNAGVTATALGLDPTDPEQPFGRVEFAGLTEDLDAQHMNRALWEATWGYFLKNMLRRLRPSDSPILLFDQRVEPREWLEEARRHFIEHVRGRGPLPAVRAGSQPYGLLPVSSLDRWHIRFDEEAGFGSFLRQLLLRLRQSWRDSAVHLPRLDSQADPTSALAQLLAIEGLSRTFRFRQVIGPAFQRNLIDRALEGVKSALAEFGLLEREVVHWPGWRTVVEDTDEKTWLRADASCRSVPSGPSLEMMTFDANAFASRDTASSAMSARTCSMFVRPRVDVWRSIPKSHGSMKFVKMRWAIRFALVDPSRPGNDRFRSRS
jgi:hypothetical protein